MLQQRIQRIQTKRKCCGLLWSLLLPLPAVRDLQDGEFLLGVRPLHLAEHHAEVHTDLHLKSHPEVRDKRME